MNKKAIAEAALVAIILAIVGGVVVGALVFNIAQKGKDQVGVDACRTSVLAAHVTKDVTVGFQATTLNCDRNEIIFTNEEEKEINEKIARSIYNCAYQFGEGSLDFTESNIMFPDGQGEDVCLICSTIKFEEGDAKEKYDPFSLFTYMDSTTAPRTTETYLQYFNRLNDQAQYGDENMMVFPILNPDVDAEYVVYLQQSKETKLENVVGFFSSLPLVGEFRQFLDEVRLSGIELRKYDPIFQSFLYFSKSPDPASQLQFYVEPKNAPASMVLVGPQDRAFQGCSRILN